MRQSQHCGLGAEYNARSVRTPRNRNTSVIPMVFKMCPRFQVFVLSYVGKICALISLSKNFSIPSTSVILASVLFSKVPAFFSLLP